MELSFTAYGTDKTRGQ